MLYLISLGIVCIMVLVVIGYSRSYSEPRREQEDLSRPAARRLEDPYIDPWSV
jgi:hypothetical protein